MLDVVCTNCKYPYPDQGVQYRCPKCGWVFDYKGELIFEKSKINSNFPGIWRYVSTFNLGGQAPMISLGEGITPLVWVDAFDRKIAFKLEYSNPTGSFKDRGFATLVSFLKSRGVNSAVEDSSGNAGASFAAYAARSGIQARVFIPDSASGPKRKQIEAYGAEVTRIMGPRSNTSQAVKVEADKGEPYASHVYLPFNIPGYATLAYELCEQIGGAPGTIILPIGQGGLFLGLSRGLIALKNAGEINGIPKLLGVQAQSCAPIWAVYNYGATGLGLVDEGETLAEGVRVSTPVRGDAILKSVIELNGEIVTVSEEEIEIGYEKLASMGFFVEHTSAVIWKPIEKLIDNLEEPIVAILTGSGLKST
jgi:threonine synthase